MNYIKLAFWTLVAIGVLFFGVRWHDSVYKAGEDHVQTLWDADKDQIAKVAADAVAKANKDRDEAIDANQEIKSEYEAQLLTTRANATQFADRLRNATSLLAAARRSTVPKAGGGPGSVPASGPTSADQLGTLAQLTADLHAECTDNADRNDAAYKQLSPQVTFR